MGLPGVTGYQPAKSDMEALMPVELCECGLELPLWDLGLQHQWAECPERHPGASAGGKYLLGTSLPVRKATHVFLQDFHFVGFWAHML